MFQTSYAKIYSRFIYHLVPVVTETVFYFLYLKTSPFSPYEEMLLSI